MPDFEMLEELELTAGIGPVPKFNVVGPAELDEQLDWPPPALADELNSMVGGGVRTARDTPDSPGIPMALAVPAKEGELKVIAEALELVEQLPELPLTPV